MSAPLTIRDSQQYSTLNFDLHNSCFLDDFDTSCTGTKGNKNEYSMDNFHKKIVLCLSFPIFITELLRN